MGKVARLKVRMKILEEKYAHLQGQHQELQEKFHACEHEYGKLIKSLARKIEELEQNKRGAKIMRNEVDEEPNSGEEEGNKRSLLFEGGHDEEAAEVENSSDEGDDVDDESEEEDVDHVREEEEKEEEEGEDDDEDYNCNYQHSSPSDEEVDKKVKEAEMDIIDVSEHDVQPIGEMVEKDREHPLLSLAQAAKGTKNPRVPEEGDKNPVGPNAAIIDEDIIVEDVNITVEEHVDHEEADNDFVSPPPRYSRRLRKKGPLLQSPFTQQSSSLAEPSSLVELVSSALPSVATEDMDENIVYYTDLNKIVKLDRETILQFVANKGSLPGCYRVSRSKVDQILRFEHIHSNTVISYLQYIKERHEDDAICADVMDSGCFLADTFAGYYLYERAERGKAKESALEEQLKDRRSRKITYYNSLGSADTESLAYAKKVSAELEKELQRRVVEESFKWKWVVHKVYKNYLQENDVDCAIFVILFADCFTRKRPINFTQADITKHILMHIATDLIRGFMSPVDVSSNRRYLLNARVMSRYKKIQRMERK